MRRKLFFWELGGFLFTGALGTLLHFVYEWSGGSALAAWFSAVNESTWEHMKLLFVPLFLFSVAQVCLLGRNYPNLLGEHLHILRGGPGGLCPGFRPAPPGKALQPLDAASGSGAFVGPGLLLCLVYVPPRPSAAVAGPGDGSLLHSLKTPLGAFSPFWTLL